MAKSSLRAYSLVLEQNGTLNASVYVGGRRQSLRTPRSLPLRSWVHVAFSYDGQTGLSRLHLNGVPVAEGRGDRGWLEANDAPLVLGSALFHSSDTADLGGGIRSFPGALDELRLFPWALSPQEVAQLARLGDARSREPAPPEPARLVVQATLDGRPVLARVVAYPEGAPEDCPEVFYTDRPSEGPKEGFPRPRVHRPGAGGPADPPRRVGVGVGEAFLPPGEAVVFVDVGGGFTMLPLERRVRLEPGGTVVLPLHLERRWNPRGRGYFAADLHLHSRASGDGVTPIEDLVKAQIAADLDLAVLSDHNTAVAHLPFREAAQRLGIPYLLSEEITTSNWGHFNPFPLDPGEVIAVSRGKRPREYFAEARAKGATLIQVNHPLWGGGQGYFTRMGDPDFDWGFRLVEVINGFNGALSSTDRRAIEAVFALWSQGRRVVATGGSDDHNAGKLVSQVGLPRTYARVDLPEGQPLTAERWLQALAQGRAFVTTGPLVYLSVDGREGPLPGPGARLLMDPEQTLRLRIEIESVRELRYLTLWHSGRALRRYALEGYEASLEWTGPARPGWYAVTVEAEGEFALTNPIWVERLPAREPPRKGGAQN